MFFVQKHNTKTGQNAKVFLDFWLESAIILSVRGVKEPHQEKGDNKMKNEYCFTYTLRDIRDGFTFEVSCTPSDLGNIMAHDPYLVLDE